jgi:hypothetical protein
MVIRLPAGRSGFKIPERARAILFFIMSKPALSPTQTLTQWLPEIFCWELRSWDVNLRLGMRRDVSPVPLYYL